MSDPLKHLSQQATTSRGSTKLNELSAWVDARFAGRDPEAVLWNRVGKVGEEHGEAVTALIGLTDANPRRNTSEVAVDHLRYELLDAMAALAAHAHLGHNRGDPLRALLQHIAHVHHRAGLSSDADDPNAARTLSDAPGAILLERAECPGCRHRIVQHHNLVGVGCSVGWGDTMVVGCACPWTGEELEQVQDWLRIPATDLQPLGGE